MKYNITPVPKPRMTQRDRWAKRPCVQRYWDFKDQIKESGLDLPVSGAHIVFIIPMPKSRPEKKKKLMDRQPHQQKPDLDNLSKAIFDSVYQSDCIIWDSRATKCWGRMGAIYIYNEKEKIR